VPTDAVGGLPATDGVLTLEEGQAPAADPSLPTFAPRTRKPGKEGVATVAQRAALTWVDETSIGRPVQQEDLTTAATAYVPVERDLLSDPPRRSMLRPAVIAPVVVIAGLLGAYSGTMLLWPLNAVTPTISAVQVQPAAAPITTPAWPKVGSAAVAVRGMPGVEASTPKASAMASITKLVTALTVLDAMPLAVGQQGPAFRFTYGDELAYWNTKAQGESALDVPVGGTLSEYQLLEGMLIGSAGNYAERLAGNLWPSDAVYASAANSWLQAHGVNGITVVEPTGFDRGNVAAPAALIALAQKALANPVIAEIVAKKSVKLPGAGNVKNTNELLADAGVVGLKTGTLVGWNLLSAKDVKIGGTIVRIYASVLDQPNEAARLAASRALYSRLTAELQPKPSVTKGTTAGIVETAWGERVDVVTSSDADVILWNGGAGTPSTSFSLGENRDKGDVVGTLSVKGPLNGSAVDLRLAQDVEGPSPWWRLTHPLDLLGLNN
jgi:D-alanyl-D-alanine carboxypeptidase (penicillin-binding protein 5/6)